MRSIVTSVLRLLYHVIMTVLVSTNCLFTFTISYVQLSQVDTTLSSTPVGPNKDNLLSLKSDIEELISLTKESLQSLEGNNAGDKGEDEDLDDKIEDSLDKEYALFKVCLR